MSATPKLLSDAELKEIERKVLLWPFGHEIGMALLSHIAALTAVSMEGEIAELEDELSEGQNR